MLTNLLVCALMLGNPVTEVISSGGQEASMSEAQVASQGAADGEKDTFWAQKRSMRIGYDMHDWQNEQGGYLPLKFSAGLANVNQVWLHKKPIGGVLKFGLDHGSNINYSLFDMKEDFSDYKGPTGYLGPNSGIYDDDDDSDGLPDIGMHYVAVGYGIGLSVTVNPVAKLRVNGYCHFVPSVAMVISNSEISAGFMPYVKYGAEVSYSKVGVGIEWGSGMSKMSDVLSQLVSDSDSSPEKKKYYSNYMRIYLSLRFGKR